MKGISVSMGNSCNYEELMALLNRSFGFDPANSVPFEGFLPKLYKREYEPWKNNVIVKADGILTAAVGVYFNEVNVAGEKLVCAGIGNVACHPEHREHGYMQRAFKRSVEEMLNNGADYSCLGGQRQRYGYFGYERAGTELVIDINRSNLKHSFGSIEAAHLQPITEQDAQLLDKVALLHEDFALRFTRPREQLYDILRSWECAPYALFIDGHFCGYAVLNKDCSDVTEFRLTDIDLIPSFFKAVLDFSQRRSVSVKLPPFESAYCDYLSAFCEDIGMGHSENYSIFNFRRVIQAFLALRAKTQQDVADGVLSMLIHGIAGDESIKITVRNGAVSVDEYNGTADIELKHNAAVACVSSLYSPVRRSLPRFCETWFPLQLFSSEIDNV